MNRKVLEHMLIDCHNHSLYSFDGQEKVADLCKNAGKLGLSVFALTDHCDMIDGIAPDALIRFGQRVDRMAGRPPGRKLPDADWD